MSFIACIAKGVAGVGALTQKSLSILDKSRESALKRSGVLSHQLPTTNEVTGVKDTLTSLFVRDPSIQELQKNRLLVPDVMERYVKGATTKTFDRVMLNPKIAKEYSYADLESELKGLKYSDDTIANLLSDYEDMKGPVTSVNQQVIDSIDNISNNIDGASMLSKGQPSISPNIPLPKGGMPTDWLNKTTEFKSPRYPSGGPLIPDSEILNKPIPDYTQFFDDAPPSQLNLDFEIKKISDSDFEVKR